MIAQAFFYNAIFFTYAMLLTDFYGVGAGEVGWYVVPFALGNVLGPLLLGPLFDTIGRKPMIAFTYAASAVLLLATGLLFRAGAADRHDPDHRLERARSSSPPPPRRPPT